MVFLFSFYKKGLNLGDQISFATDSTITATVAGEREVDYDHQTWKLSPLTYKIYGEQGQLNTSGAYLGASHLQYAGKRLKFLPDIV